LQADHILPNPQEPIFNRASSQDESQYIPNGAPLQVIIFANELLYAKRFKCLISTFISDLFPIYFGISSGPIGPRYPRSIARSMQWPGWPALFNLSQAAR
jgi:hypothetical protein